jgi:hypothetical protein
MEAAWSAVGVLKALRTVDEIVIWERKFFYESIVMDACSGYTELA